MKKSFLLATILFLCIGAVMAQQPTGALTIFSEDGDKFFLILNGERQNNTAQTNLRVEDLPQPYYTAKIIFEDKNLPEITKNNLMIVDAGSNALYDVTYKIKKDKNNGKMTLKYFSAIPVQQGFVAPPNVVVMHYGAPAAVVPVPATRGTVTQTTTTTTTTGTPGGGVNMNVNVEGLNMGININDPGMMTGTTTTQTTTTRSHTSTTAGSGTVIEPSRPAPVGCNNNVCMSSTNFASALATVKKQGFDDTRLSTAKQIANTNCLSANQVADVCKEFGFEESKLAFAKYAYDHCTEPSNYFKINNVFGFSSSVDELNEYIQNHR